MFFTLLTAVAAVTHTHQVVQLAQMTYVKVSNPGAGMNVGEPFQSIHKDGYYHIECMGDAMNRIADAHGANKFSYQMKTDVSIVRYEDTVDHEDKEDMTPLVCFNFCRTIPQMSFFGLIHGRDCYCTPYYQRTAEVSGVCDRMCPGDGLVTCGGETMTDMYEMHSCDDTAETLNAAISAADGSKTGATQTGKEAMALAREMEGAADALQATANTGGDMTSNDYAQKAKVFAGELKHLGEAAKAAGTKLAGEITNANSMRVKDFTIPQNSYDAEDSMKKMVKLSTAADAAAAAAEPKIEVASPDVKGVDARTAIDTFEPVLTATERWAFIEESNATVTGKQSTCEGELASRPKTGLNVQECAEACYSNAPKSSPDYCVGFQHYTVQGEKDLCFLLKGFTKVWKFDCDYTFKGFLQTTKNANVENKCMVRHDWASEAPVKPEIVEIDRCFGDNSTP